MSRQYVIGSWNDADQYDYSGEQVGQRNAPSKRIHFNADGTACVGSYSDDEPKAKAKPKTSVMDKIDLANRHLNRLELMSAELESDFDNERLTLEEYSRGRRIMDERLKKAWGRVAKQEGWKDEDTGEQEPAKANLWTENRTVASKKDSIFLTLPVDNVFYRLYIVVTQAKKALNSLKGK